MAMARSRNWSEAACIVEVKNFLCCLGRRVARRAACCGNCSGRLNPADNMLPDHVHVQSGETRRNGHEVQHIRISQSLVLLQHTPRILTGGGIDPSSDRKWP